MEYKAYLDIYWKWFNNRFGFTPKIDGAQGKALKSIIKYLESQNKEQALHGWKLIFLYWDRVDKFYQAQTKLTQINSNIQIIIAQIKQNNGQASKNGSYFESLSKRIQGLAAEGN